MTDMITRAPRGANGRSTTSRPARIGGADVRAAILGHYAPGLIVQRQAHRITDIDSDELIMMQARGDWWVARRISDAVVVWACGDIDAAHSEFDDLLRVADGRGPWIESRDRGRVHADGVPA